MKGYRVLIFTTVLLGYFIVFSDVVKAETACIGQGEYTYTVSEAAGTKYAYISKYDGTDETIDLTGGLGGYPVGGFTGNGVFSKNETIRKIRLPDTVHSMSDGEFSYLYGLEEIVYENGNENAFYTIDGVLYAANILIAYPAAKKNETITISNRIMRISPYAFEKCRYLKRIYFPKDVKIIGVGAVKNSRNPIDLIFRWDTASEVKRAYGVFFNLPEGSRILVKNEEVAREVREQMKVDSEILAGNLKVEVENIPAEDLCFQNGIKELDWTADREKYVCFYEIPYVVSPAEAGDTITWSSENSQICEVSENQYSFYTVRGGRTDVIGRDEHGHEIRIHVLVREKLKVFDVPDELIMDVRDENLTEGNHMVSARLYPSTATACQSGVSWSVKDTNVARIVYSDEWSVVLKAVQVGKTVLTAIVDDAGSKMTKEIVIDVRDFRSDSGQSSDAGAGSGSNHPDETEKDSESPDQGGGNMNTGNSGIGNTNANTGNTSTENAGTENTNTGNSGGGNINTENAGGKTEDQKKLKCTAAYTKAYGAKSFQIKIANATGKVKYVSSNSKVAAVSSKGKVTVKNTGCAEVKISCSTGSAKCKIYVVPTKVKIRSLKRKKSKQLEIIWNIDQHADAYEIVIAEDKQFRKKIACKKITVSKSQKSKKTMKYIWDQKKLKTKKKALYVRIRAGKKIQKKLKYGSWSAEKLSE